MVCGFPADNAALLTRVIDEQAVGRRGNQQAVHVRSQLGRIDVLAPAAEVCNCPGHNVI